MGRLRSPHLRHRQRLDWFYFGERGWHAHFDSQPIRAYVANNLYPRYPGGNQFEHNHRLD
jgi:hypothetical protein